MIVSEPVLIIQRSRLLIMLEIVVCMALFGFFIWHAPFFIQQAWAWRMHSPYVAGLLIVSTLAFLCFLLFIIIRAICILCKPPLIASVYTHGIQIFTGPFINWRDVRAFSLEYAHSRKMPVPRLLVLHLVTSQNQSDRNKLVLNLGYVTLDAHKLLAKLLEFHAYALEK